MTATNADDVDPTPDVVVHGDFDAFYRAEYRSLLRLAWAMTGRRDLGEELVQDAMIKVHRRWSRISGYDRPGAYARRILLNDATSTARRRTAERRALQTLAQTTAPTAAPPPPPDDRFWGAVRALPERQSQCVALHYIEDRSVDEVADVLGIAANTVKVHLHRGRLALARTLADEEDDR